MGWPYVPINTWCSSVIIYLFFYLNLPEVVHAETEKEGKLLRSTLEGDGHTAIPCTPFLSPFRSFAHMHLVYFSLIFFSFWFARGHAHPPKRDREREGRKVWKHLLPLPFLLLGFVAHILTSWHVFQATQSGTQTVRSATWDPAQVITTPWLALV